ncbi:MAG: hypothetical protein ACOC26_04050 [Halochromatium sp.]|uniref:hypothetical protein n=1 Tax=Halochromatium sp. TaxID=2049430 RepID=UPI00397D5422
MSITRLLPTVVIALLASMGLGLADTGNRAQGAPPDEQQAVDARSAAPQAPMPAPTPAPTPVPGAHPPQTAGMHQPQIPRWLEEVRAQRRALHEQRRAAHQARHDALDPLGAVKRDERQAQRRRRRQEMREMIETERRLYRNRGPWFSPLTPVTPMAPTAGGPLMRGSLAEDQAPERSDEPSSASGEPLPPSDWNNRWYYRGW